MRYKFPRLYIKLQAQAVITADSIIHVNCNFYVYHMLTSATPFPDSY